MPAAAAPAILARMSALADPTRARVLRLLERQELSVAELCAVLQLPQSTVSRHLKVLADDGWVTARPEGTSRLYRMAPGGPDAGARRLWALVREDSAEAPVAAQDDQRLASIVAERRTRSQAFFSSAAGQWDRLRRELFGDRFDLQGLAGLLDERWVVGDLGCGAGHLAAALAPFVQRVVAVDGSRAMLAAARRRLAGLANVEVRHGELEALPIRDRALDAAVLCLALHHLPDPPAALGESGRVLRPGGRLLVIDMLEHDRREYQQTMGHVWLGFSRARVAGWLRAAGFEGVRIAPLAPAPQAQGPALFAATARRAGAHERLNGRRR